MIKIEHFPFIPKPLDNELMRCPHCFSVMVLVLCNQCGNIARIPLIFKK